MTTNKEATRYYSDIHEKSICKALGATQTPNSGAGRFKKGDVIQEEASLLIEAKTVMSEKKSVSIKEDWIIKNREESFTNRLNNSCICFNFKPQGCNYYIVDEKLMKFLCEKLIEENEA